MEPDGKLEKLLGRLFDDDEYVDVEVVRLPKPIRPRSTCCAYSYDNKDD